MLIGLPFTSEFIIAILKRDLSVLQSRCEIAHRRKLFLLRSSIGANYTIRLWKASMQMIQV